MFALIYIQAIFRYQITFIGSSINQIYLLIRLDNFDYF